MKWSNKRSYYSYRNYNKSAARLINWTCSLLFIIFSMVYLVVFQKDLIESLHFSTAKTYNEFKIIPAAIIVTVILMILEWGLNLLLRLRGRVHALAYLPSFLGLVTMTGFGRDVYTGGFNYVWWWLMPLLTAVFVLLVVIARRFLKVTRDWPDTLSLINCNLSLMLVMCIVTLCLGNSDKSFHNELRMESLMVKHQNEEVLKVAEKSLKTTRTMSALRVMAMVKEGSLGNRLFEYPQYFKSEGLFFDSDSLKTLRYTNDSVYALIGDKPIGGERMLPFLKRVYDEKKDSCCNIRMYYGAALLLEKDLDELSLVLENQINDGDTLQRYFVEASIMYKDKNRSWKFKSTDNDSLYYEKYEKYKSMQKEEYKSKDEERNLMRLEFGDTFWWYYDYQE